MFEFVVGSIRLYIWAEEQMLQSDEVLEGRCGTIFVFVVVVESEVQTTESFTMSFQMSNYGP